MTLQLTLLTPRKKQELVRCYAKRWRILKRVVSIAEEIFAQLRKTIKIAEIL